MVKSGQNDGCSAAPSICAWRCSSRAAAIGTTVGRGSGAGVRGQAAGRALVAAIDRSTGPDGGTAGRLAYGIRGTAEVGKRELVPAMVYPRFVFLHFGVQTYHLTRIYEYRRALYGTLTCP